MAWVTVRQATELTGKARSSLYRDMAKGRVSYRTEADGGRVVDTSELIRVYGELRLIETHDRDGLRLPDETEKTVSEALIAEIKALREEVAGLRQEMQAMRLLEHKTETAETPRRWWQGTAVCRRSPALRTRRRATTASCSIRPTRCTWSATTCWRIWCWCGPSGPATVRRPARSPTGLACSWTIPCR